MPSILVLEDDPRSLERIHHTLGVAGWRVRVVDEPAQAFQAATSEQPDLVIVGAAVAGAAAVAGSFSRRTGGPGVLGLLPPGAGPASFAGLAADILLAQPFSDQELLAAVQRAGTAPRAATTAPARTATVDAKLTSHDIFGDVLAEMEMADEPAAPPPAKAPAPPPPAVPRPAPPRSSSDDEINRKLERTLSGVLGADLGRPRLAAPPAPSPQAVAPAPPRPAAPPAVRTAPPAAPPRKPSEASGDDDIDAILSRTLGNLEISGRSRPAAPRPAVPPPVSVPAPPPEGTAVRKAPRSTDGGLSELAELTRTFRTTPAAAPPPPRVEAPAPVPLAAPPAPAPPPFAPAAAAPPPAEEPSPFEELPSFEEPFPIEELSPAEALASPPPPVFEPPVSAPPPVEEPPAVSTPPPAPPELLSGSIFGVDPFDLTALEVPPPVEPEEPEPAVVEAEPDAPFDLVDLEVEPEPETPVPPASEEPVPVFSGDFAAPQRIPVLLDDTSLSVPGAERFGQYTLLERIAAGGMAEVWKARMRGVEGFQKTVAIKKILPHMTDNSEFIGMFIDEAKLAAQLSHPNIVHIYDLGKIGRDYYIAMEYVEGKDLRSLLNAARRKGEPLSLGLALLISARLASALDYAHRKRDFEGKELALVHRDVSPQNVLLTREGDVKLCDFGIAKAVSKAGQTQIGSLKGKLQYMSPEQAWGRPVDSRSDIFSLGAVLFEMLTGERLFAGDNEMSILEAVRNGHIRTPRDIDPAIPPEVDEIVARALAYDVRDRFQSAGEMMQRIESVLHTLVPSPGPGELSVYLERVLAPEPSGDELFLPAPPPPSPASFPARLPDAGVPPSLFAPSPAPAEAVQVEAVAPVGDVHVEETGGRRSRLLLVIAIVVLLAAVIATFFFLRGRRGPAAPPPAITEPAAVDPASQPAAGTGASIQPEAPAAGAPPAAPVDVEAILKEELAKREQELRRKYEARTQQLEREVEKAQKDAQSREQGSGGEGQPAPSVAPPPRPRGD